MKKLLVLFIVFLTSGICYSQKTTNLSLWELGWATSVSGITANSQVNMSTCNGSAGLCAMSDFMSGSTCEPSPNPVDMFYPYDNQDITFEFPYAQTKFQTQILTKGKNFTPYYQSGIGWTIGSANTHNLYASSPYPTNATVYFIDKYNYGGTYGLSVSVTIVWN